MLVPDQSPEFSSSCPRQVGAQAERAHWKHTYIHTLRVNEAAYLTHTTLNSSRETDALEIILEMLSMCLFKGVKSIRAVITVTNHAQDQQWVELQTIVSMCVCVDTLS